MWPCRQNKHQDSSFVGNSLKIHMILILASKTLSVFIWGTIKMQLWIRKKPPYLSWLLFSLSLSWLPSSTMRERAVSCGKRSYIYIPLIPHFPPSKNPCPQNQESWVWWVLVCLLSFTILECLKKPSWLDVNFSCTTNCSKLNMDVCKELSFVSPDTEQNGWDLKLFVRELEVLNPFSQL